MRPLPYPGHTWSFTQHAVAIDPETLYVLLKCASPFVGHGGDYGAKITQLLVQEEVLTPNLRDGREDAWRDYQQVLPELGLIYSTLQTRELTFTDAGNMYLAGEVGFTELIGIQALNYQYPNGQKWVIQRRTRELLEAEHRAVPTTMIELQSSHGILLKPGVLILRILLELLSLEDDPYLTASECQAYLIPCRTNDEWPIALKEIIAGRAKNAIVDGVNRESRRNIQDWFKFLKKTGLFESADTNTIRLTARAKQNVAELNEVCAEHENPATFWIPTTFTAEERLTWFDWFGRLSFESQKLLETENFDDQYIEENYIGGLEEEDDDQIVVGAKIGLDLRPVDFERLARDPDFSFPDDVDLNEVLEKLKKGAYKKHAKTVLHDQIVKELAEHLQKQGATVMEDPGSIDLHAQWPTGEQAILEIKTATRRNLQDRIRRAIGQVEEYAYKWAKSGGPKADRVIVTCAPI